MFKITSRPFRIYWSYSVREGWFAHGALRKLQINFGASKELLRISRASCRDIKLSLFRALFNSSTLASSVILRADSVESGAPSKQIKSMLILATNSRRRCSDHQKSAATNSQRRGAARPGQRSALGLHSSLVTQSRP